MEQKRLLTSTDVKEMLGIGFSQLYRLSNSGELPYIELPNLGHGMKKHRRYDPADVQALIEKGKRGGANVPGGAN